MKKWNSLQSVRLRNVRSGNGRIEVVNLRSDLVPIVYWSDVQAQKSKQASLEMVREISREDILLERNRGLSLRQIGNIHGTSHTHVRKILNEVEMENETQRYIN